MMHIVKSSSFQNINGCVKSKRKRGKDAKQCKSEVSALPVLPAGHAMGNGSLVTMRLDCKQSDKHL